MVPQRGGAPLRNPAFFFWYHPILDLKNRAEIWTLKIRFFFSRRNRFWDFESSGYAAPGQGPVGISPAPSELWAHSCGGGKVLELKGDECSHLYYCSQQGRAHATHDAVLEQLRGMLLDAEYGYGWRVERTLENLSASIAAPGGLTCLVLILLACVSWWTCP